MSHTTFNPFILSLLTTWTCMVCKNNEAAGSSFGRVGCRNLRRLVCLLINEIKDSRGALLRVT